MRPAFSSRTKRRGIAAHATASGEDFNNGLDVSQSFAIWLVLTQSSIVIMSRRPMIIFDETVVSGTVLLLTPLLKLRPFLNLRSALNWGRANLPDLPVGAVSRVKSSRGSEIFSTACLLTSGTAANCCESTGRVASKPMGGSAYARAYGEVIRIDGSRSILPDPHF